MSATTTPPSDDLSNPYGYSEMDWAAQLGPPMPPPARKSDA